MIFTMLSLLAFYIWMRIAQLAIEHRLAPAAGAPMNLRWV